MFRSKLNRLLRIASQAVWLALLFPALLSSEGNIPRFSLEDQNGKKFSSDSLSGKTFFLLGCGFHDIVICRKHGRKIYWKMQTLLSDDDSVEFLAYLNLQLAPKQVLDYISGEKEKDYESILLDKKGSLSEGLQDGRSFLRIYSRNGSLIHKEYFTAVDDSTVKRLFEFVKKDRLKGRK